MGQLCFLGKFSLLMLKNEKQILLNTHKQTKNSNVKLKIRQCMYFGETLQYLTNCTLPTEKKQHFFNIIFVL